MRRILVLGAGFAGLWSAVGAARKLEEIGIGAEEAEILVIDRNAYHNIRVRNYEADLDDVAIPLDDVFGPIGVRHMAADVEAIDCAAQCVTVKACAGPQRVTYDRLVFALGSQLSWPNIPGLQRHAFNVDTYAEALRLNAHIKALGNEAPPARGRHTVVVAGAGFTGVEVAAEMKTILDRALAGPRRIILLDTKPVVGAMFGDHARPIVEEALTALGIETFLDADIARVEATGIHLTSGETIPTQTLIWCAGMRANRLAGSLSAACDPLGRLAVDDFMRVPQLENVFAAGDSASSLIDGRHETVMSCQYARPMGRFAGHNVVAHLYGLPMLPLRIDWYVTVLDLGAWGALYTAGRDRRVLTSGASAKAVKETINRLRIYPPRNGSRAEILAAAAPIVQAAPPDVQQAMDT